MRGYGSGCNECDGGYHAYGDGGFLRIDQAGRYRFGFDGEGISTSMQIWDPSGVEVFRLVTSNVEITDWVQLARLHYRVRVTASRSGRQGIRFRALWEMEQTANGGECSRKYFFLAL